MKQILRRTTALFLIAIHVLDFSFMRAYALTGGPSQPEAQSFTPADASGLVNSFTGDLSYNIPLLDVGGYPINIAYQSGISMDQEASWVGLGWNINPGVASRNLRGIPDDFSGDTIIKEMNLKNNNTYGAEVGITGEVFGFQALSVGASVNVNYNNYTGIGMEQGVSGNLSFSSADKGKGLLTSSLGLNVNSSSNSGLSITPSLSFSVRTKETENEDDCSYYSTSVGIGVSSPFNSRAGLRQLSINTSLTLNKRIPHYFTSKPDTRRSKDLFSTNAVFDFGTPTYTPSVDMPMRTYSGTGRFTGGGELFGFHGSAHIQGYFSSQQLAVNKIQNPAYGYLNSARGQQRNDAVLDFNREKDGSYARTENSLLPLTNFTFDTYSVLAQGISMSYRPVRNDVGFVYDAASYTTSDGGSIGVEVGGGNIWHGGADVKLDNVDSRSGAWRNGNEATTALHFKDQTTEDFYEPFYFREAGERSVNPNKDWLSSYGGYDPVMIKLEQKSKFNTRAVKKIAKKKGDVNLQSLPTVNTKKEREPRNQVISYLKNEELANFGLLNNQNPGHKQHHIGEVSVLQPTGERYFFSVPAYNTLQREVTFAVGQKMTGGNGLVGDCLTGLVSYNHNNQSGDNSIKNERGIDHYFNAITTPEYTHSHLLTAVVSADYVDVDGIRGPSDRDLGTYTRFYYQEIENYPWRVPFTQANFNEGLKSDKQDDRASYIYGEKELWYLDSIVTKNHIAIFHKSTRKDGFGASEAGVLNASKAQLKLDSISLYSKPDFRVSGSNAIPLKRVHFEYSYELCPNVPNNNGIAEYFDLNRDGVNENINAAKGKLTLKRIFFTYQNVQRGRFNPYEFSYSTMNPSYDIKAYDRWGCYKASNPLSSCDPLSPETNAEAPYATQNQAMANLWSQAWSLTQVDLPSGGKMNIYYESDDYSYVQHKKATQMARVIGAVSDTANINTLTDLGMHKRLSLSTGTNASSRNKYLIFELQDTVKSIDKYFEDINSSNPLYFKFLMNFQQTEFDFGPSINNDVLYDYVPGYAEIQEKFVKKIGGVYYGVLKLKSVDMGDGNTGEFNPISKAAIQYGRMQLSKIMYNQDVTDMGFGRQMLQAMQNSSFAKNIKETINGANLEKWKEGRGRKFISGKSWIRVNNVVGRKLGGGSRVKKITMSDEWSNMTQASARTMQYGQEYIYELPDGTSSGVAAYEPLLGGEENPFRKPVFYQMKQLLAPDYKYYKEEPFGESFFPGASVGYSRVITRNLQRQDVTKHGTGFTEEEFYTYKDFPVITKRTDVDMIPDKSSPVGLSSLFKVNVRDYMTVSQGYYVELNDMHGKQKKKSVYQEGKYDMPISSVEYKYQQDMGIYANTSRLNNQVKVVDEKGDVLDREVGVLVDMVADMREQKTDMTSAGARFNTDGFYIPPFFTIVVPMILPSYSSEKTQFRSSVLTKVVQRFGLLQETTAKDLGSIVSTKNIAYDSQTGDVILSEVVNDFNDPVYSLKFPAHWHYKNMGQAYKNISLTKKNVLFNLGFANISRANQYFFEGDELALSDGEKAWVTEVSEGTIKAVNKHGNLIHGKLDVKVIRSGKKNLISASMAELTLLKNPLSSFKSNIYDQVLNASALEYSEGKRTYCNCLPEEYVSNHANPYVIGTKGNWHVSKTHTHLSDRLQSKFNDNTNLRKDGVFESFTPFYKFKADQKWHKDLQNWTYAAEVTEINAVGQELENKDALGRYASSNYGYNGTLPISITSNARYKEAAFDGFEDYSYNPCLDDHFKFVNYVGQITNETSHTGDKSIKVLSPVSMSKDIENCQYAECDLILTQSVANVAPFTDQVESLGGTEPYAFDYMIYSGSPMLAPLSSSSFGLAGSGYKVKFIVTDAKGCTAIKLIEK